MAEVSTSVAWLSRLIQIPSVNVNHAGPRAGDVGERALGNEVATALESLNADWVERDVVPESDDRANVYGFFQGATDRLVAIDVHLDTVGVEQMVGDPFSGRIVDGRVWGRGAVDTKPMLAAVISALEELRAEGIRPQPSLLLVGTVSEESGGFAGAGLFADWVRRRSLQVAELVIAEPTRGAPVFGHQGGMGVEITISGRTAHSSRPELGLNAIDAAADVVVAIREEHERLTRQTVDARLGPASVCTVEVSGGAGRNVVPDQCSVFVTRRLTDGETMAEVGEQIAMLVQNVSKLPLTAEVRVGGDPFITSPDGRLVRRLATWSGQAPTTSRLGTNAFRYGGLADEAVIFGPGSPEQAHAPVEWCDIDQLEQARAVVLSWLTEQPSR